MQLSHLSPEKCAIRFFLILNIVRCIVLNSCTYAIIIQIRLIISNVGTIVFIFNVIIISYEKEKEIKEDIYFVNFSYCDASAQQNMPLNEFGLDQH